MRRFILQSVLHETERVQIQGTRGYDALDYHVNTKPQVYTNYNMFHANSMRGAEHKAETSPFINGDNFWEKDGEFTLFEYELDDNYFRDFYDGEIIDVLERAPEEFKLHSELIKTNHLDRNEERELDGWELRI